MKSWHVIRQRDADRPLQGVQVIYVMVKMEFGVVPRVFKVMGIDQVLLVKLAKDELAFYRGF